MAPVCKHGGGADKQWTNWTVVITKVFLLPFLFHLSFMCGLENMWPWVQGKRATQHQVQYLKRRE